jgi:hypothetical protein
MITRSDFEEQCYYILYEDFGYSKHEALKESKALTRQWHNNSEDCLSPQEVIEYMISEGE